MSDTESNDEATAAQVAAINQRARQAPGQPLGGVGPAGSRVDTRSAEQRANEAAARQAVAVPTPLGGVDPTPRPPTVRQTRRIDTGGQPLGGVGPAGSTIPKGGGGVGGIVGKNQAQLLREQEQAREAAAAKVAAAAPEVPAEPAPEPEAEPSPEPEAVEETKKGKAKPKGDG